MRWKLILLLGHGRTILDVPSISPWFLLLMSGATNLWTNKIKSLYMLWSQYKLATKRCTEFLCKKLLEFWKSQIGIPIFWLSRNWNFKKKLTGIFGVVNGIGIPPPMGVPEIGTENWNSQPRFSFCKWSLLAFHRLLMLSLAMWSHQWLSFGFKSPLQYLTLSWFSIKNEVMLGLLYLLCLTASYSN